MQDFLDFIISSFVGGFIGLFLALLVVAWLYRRIVPKKPTDDDEGI